MKTRLYLYAACAGILLASSLPAQARTPWYGWVWPEKRQDYQRPYLEGPKIPHNTLWDNDDWTPQNWIDARGSEQAVMNGLYRAGIITDIDVDEAQGSAVLEVGREFVRLSRQEKRRVVAFVDHVLGITGDSKGSMIAIEEDCTGNMIGLHTRRGLQLQ